MRSFSFICQLICSKGKLWVFVFITISFFCTDAIFYVVSLSLSLSLSHHLPLPVPNLRRVQVKK